MKLDYKKLNDEAKRKQISVYRVIKRKIGFRKCEKHEPDCRLCNHLFYGDKIGLRQKYFCDYIGVSVDKVAEVGNDTICSLFDRIKKHIAHDNEKYIDSFMDYIDTNKEV